MNKHFSHTCDRYLVILAKMWASSIKASFSGCQIKFAIYKLGKKFWNAHKLTPTINCFSGKSNSTKSSFQTVRIINVRIQLFSTLDFSYFEQQMFFLDLVLNLRPQLKSHLLTITMNVSYDLNGLFLFSVDWWKQKWKPFDV